MSSKAADAKKSTFTQPWCEAPSCYDPDANLVIVDDDGIRLCRIHRKEYLGVSS